MTNGEEVREASWERWPLMMRSYPGKEGSRAGREAYEKKTTMYKVRGERKLGVCMALRAILQGGVQVRSGER